MIDMVLILQCWNHQQAYIYYNTWDIYVFPIFSKKYWYQINFDKNTFNTFCNIMIFNSLIWNIFSNIYENTSVFCFCQACKVFSSLINWFNGKAKSILVLVITNTLTLPCIISFKLSILLDVELTLRLSTTNLLLFLIL